MNSQQCQLVLDIGTHKVLALVVRPAGTGVEVLASAFVRHQDRAMRDGQVHDVEEVARTVRRAVDQVSQAVGVRFSGAHIAAAGRALKTSRGGSERSEAHPVSITSDVSRALEWEAVSDAQLQLLESLPPEEREKGFYCIAHTVVEYRLDGETIAALAGQRGKVFSVEVLATFLPGVVVDSLEAVLVEAGLAMHGLTLEPVAALEAVIPATMRHLNLALVDIGAGTSDIALTGDGMVQAFAMVPRGGDAITEAVSKAFLLDFPVAEQVKRVAAAGDAAAVANVLGDTVTISPEDVAAAIDDTLRLLVDDIARALDRWTPDGSAPSQAAGSPGAASAGSIDAVLLVGGGSHTPGLPQALARRIGLTDSRIAVRDRKAVRDAVGEDRLSGADAVTALGIALRAVRGKEMPPVRVRINGRPVSLFQPDRCTVQEAARIAGIPVAQLMGRPGPGITVTLNGVVTALPGTRGRPAAVTVNGQAASLDTRLKNQDEITLKLPTPGSPPVVTVADMAARWLEQREREGIRRPRVRFNGVERPLPVWLERNRRRALPTDLIEDRDVIDVRFVATASELVMALQDADTKPAAHMEAGAAGTADHDGAARPPRRPAGTCTVNGLPVELSQFATLLRNGRPARWTDPVSDGDVWELRHDEPVTVGRVLEHLGLAPQRAIHIVLNGQPTNVLLPVDIQINAAPVTADAPVHPGDEIEVESTGPVALYQILPHAGVSPESLATSGRLVLQVRGQRAGFTTPVSDGDHVVIRYEP